jgi:hypothetical protein
MPANLKIFRSYGFVLNSVEQIRILMDTDTKNELYRVHYLADHEPIELSDWASEIIQSSNKGKMYRPPWVLLKIAAKVGDLLKFVGIKAPPITSFRLQNMTTNSVYDTDSWKVIYPKQTYSMHEGVRITVDWLNCINSDS